MATKELAKPNAKEIELAYAAIMDGEALPVSNDPEAVSRAIIDRIATAETFEEAFAPQELKGWKEFIGVPVQVKSFKLNPTTYGADENGGSSVYAVVDIVTPDGVLESVTCGGRNVLTQLVRGLEKGWLEDHTFALESKPTAGGNEALWLRAVE
jgi:hypothetical protein